MVCEIGIYELNYDSWRVLGDVTSYDSQEWLNLRRGVFLMGNTYWIYNGYGVNYILEFDFTTERPRRLSLPYQSDPYRDETNTLAISVVREEKLALLRLDRDSSEMKIWVTNTKIDEAKDLSWSDLKSLMSQQSDAEVERSYKSFPSDLEWERGELICELLRPFAEITNFISGSSYPTSNLYFMQVWKINSWLITHEESDDLIIREMVETMKEKFDKYCEEFSDILAIAAVLDPRLKLAFLEYCYDTLMSFKRAFSG